MTRPYLKIQGSQLDGFASTAALKCPEPAVSLENGGQGRRLQLLSGSRAQPLLLASTNSLWCRHLMPDIDLSWGTLGFKVPFSRDAAMLAYGLGYSSVTSPLLIMLAASVF